MTPPRVTAATERKSSPRSDRYQARLAMGAAAVLSVRQAADLLPWDDASARRWLRAQGLVRTVDGREVVIWARVLDAIDAAGDERPVEPPPPPRRRRKASPLPRIRVEPIR